MCYRNPPTFCFYDQVTCLPGCALCPISKLSIIPLCIPLEKMGVSGAMLFETFPQHELPRKKIVLESVELGAIFKLTSLMQNYFGQACQWSLDPTISSGILQQKRIFQFIFSIWCNKSPVGKGHNQHKHEYLQSPKFHSIS